MKHLERIILCLAIIIAATTLAACNSDDNNNENDACPGGDAPTVTDMACLLHYDDASAKWLAYPVGTDSPFSIGGYCDGVVITAQNVSRFISTHDDVTAIVCGSYSFDSSEPSGSGVLYRYTLYISSLITYTDWCGTKE